MYNKLHTYLTETNILFNKQFGFRAKQSTEHAITKLVTATLNETSEEKYTLGVFSNLSKAFDTVRSCHQRCSVRKDILRNFAQFAGKQLCQSLFFKKVTVTKVTMLQVFSCKFCETSKNTFFTEPLWATASLLLTIKSYLIN